MDLENVIEDFDSFIDFEIEERLLDELDELSILEKFKSLFDTEKRLLDELSIKKKEILKELKEILYNRDDKEREIKKLHELIEKEMFPKEYEEYRKY